MTSEKSSQKSMMWIVLFLFIAMLFAGILFEKWHKKNAGEIRNSFFRRGWVEHVLSAKKNNKDETLIVIISNSQGYGREISDEATYSFLLEKQLEERFKKEVRVLNWSIPAGRAPEFVVLAAAAKCLEPDILFVISSPNNFQNRWMKLNQQNGSRKNWASDCYQLLGFSKVRKSIPQFFLSHFFRPIDHFDILLARCFKLWRYKEVIAEKLMEWKNIRAFEKHPQAEKWFFRPSPPKERLVSILKRAIARAETSNFSLASENISWELVEYFLSTSRNASSKKIYVSMPHHSSLKRATPGLSREFNAKFESEGFIVKDFSERIPDDHYLTLTHLNQSGHAAMADLLSGLAVK